MRSIKKELTKNNVVIVFCVSMVIISNFFIYMLFAWQNNQLLNDYQHINGLILINNDRKTNFKLYCKSQEIELLNAYHDNCDELNTSLSKLEDKMQYSNMCKMMYRLVCQVVNHSQEKAEEYVNPEHMYNTGLLNYLDEVDLELENCMNQLVNHYLEYQNEYFGLQSQRLKVFVIVLNAILAVGCISAIYKNYIINRSVMKSIEDLTGAAIEITNQNFSAEDMEDMGFYELNQVSGTFDHMKHTIRNMLVELEEKHRMKEYLQEAKIKELQMQMNPHFLFNSLSLVVRNIQLNKKDTAVQLIQSISKILRSSIEIKSLAIPLDDEIELLQAYLYIQKLHMRGRVSFHLDVRKSFVEEDYLIPPLTIQPLVENSVKHGLKDVINDGRVEILITEKTDYMEVVVSDNGVGFSEEALMNNVKKKNKDGISKTSIGFLNVRERLKLYYRRDDVMKVERIAGITKITLKLYKNRERQVEKECYES